MRSNPGQQPKHIALRPRETEDLDAGDGGSSALPQRYPVSPTHMTQQKSQGMGVRVDGSERHFYSVQPASRRAHISHKHHPGKATRTTLLRLETSVSRSLASIGAHSAGDTSDPQGKAPIFRSPIASPRNPWWMRTVLLSVLVCTLILMGCTTKESAPKNPVVDNLEELERLAAILASTPDDPEQMLDTLETYIFESEKRRAEIHKKVLALGPRHLSEVELNERDRLNAVSHRLAAENQRLLHTLREEPALLVRYRTLAATLTPASIRDDAKRRRDKRKAAQSSPPTKVIPFIKPIMKNTETGTDAQTRQPKSATAGTSPRVKASGRGIGSFQAVPIRPPATMQHQQIASPRSHPEPPSTLLDDTKNPPPPTGNTK